MRVIAAEVVVVSILAFVLYGEWQRYSLSEITAEEYRELEALAAKSCSGRDALRQAALKGPIDLARHGEIKQELWDLSLREQTRSARAHILGETSVCHPVQTVSTN